MKQTLLFSFKIWLTSSLLAIGAISFYIYQLNYRSLSTFGATGWMPSIIVYYWIYLEPGFIVIWLIMASIIQQANRTTSLLFRKKLNIFLLAEALTTLWIIIFEFLFKPNSAFFPGLFLWLICSSALAFPVMIYRLENTAALDNQPSK